MNKQKMFTETVIKKAIELKTDDRTWYDVSRRLGSLGYTRPNGQMLNPASLCAIVHAYGQSDQQPKVTVKATPAKTKTQTHTGTDLMLARFALRSNKLSDAQKVQLTRQLLTC